MPRNKGGSLGIGYVADPAITHTSTHTYIDPKTALGSAHWTLQCVLHLITFLQPHISGDGHKYKPAVRQAAADHLNQYLIRGGPKTARGIGTKIRDVCLVFSINF
jgi:hypothetical protein